MKNKYLFLTLLVVAYVLISGKSLDTLILAISSCIGGWVGCYHGWIKLNNGIEKGIYEPPWGEDFALILASIILPILFSIYLSAIYVLICDIIAMMEVMFQPAKTLLAITGFIIGAVFFSWGFCRGIEKTNK